MRTSLSAIAFAGAGVLALPGYAAAEQPIQLDRIVISAGKEKVAIDTPQSVSVVDQEDLDEEQPTTLGDALTDLPGVKAVGSDRVLGESFNIRGIGTLAASDESKIIIQVDGATKFYEQYRMGSFFSDPELYKRVEVLRGPASSTLYGAGALAGVINVTTKDAADYLSGGDKMAFRQKVAGNSNGSGFLTSSIAAARPTDQLDLLGAFVYRRSGEFKDGAGKEIRGSDFKAPSGLLKGSYSFGADQEHKLKASYQHWTTEDKGAEYSQTGTTGFGKVDREVTDETVVLGYSYLPDNMLIDLNATLSYSDTKVVQNNAQFKGGRSSLFNDTKYGYATWQGRVENTSSFTGEGWENYLTVGIGTERQTRTADQEKLKNNKNSGGITFHPGGETVKNGLYAQNELILWDKLTLIPGLRIDRQTVKPGSRVTAADRKTTTGTAISPKLAMFYEIDRNFGVFRIGCPDRASAGAGRTL